jgi:ubiquitin-like 1-activating enzyme E1 A
LCQRTTAAIGQIQSLNPLVSITALPTLSPFIRGPRDGAVVHGSSEMLDFLKREKVDVVVACDMTRSQLVSYTLASL